MDRPNLCSAPRQTQARTDGHTQSFYLAFVIPSQAVMYFDAVLCVEAVMMSGCDNCVDLKASDKPPKKLPKDC
jgi:hypothetical protein